MRASVIAVVALLMLAGPALAEPAKRDALKPVAEQKRPTTMVLASADTVRPPTSPQANAEPAGKRVVPRVTTCRCGDPQPDPETQEQ